MAKPKKQARAGRVILDGSSGQVSRGCLWIEDDPQHAGWRFCQQPRVEGVWCSEHAGKIRAGGSGRKSVTPVQPKRFSKVRAS